MLGSLGPWKRKKNYVCKYICPQNGSELGLLALNGNARDEIVKQFRDNFTLQGDHIIQGGKASPAPLLTLLGAGGALSLSSAASGSLFVATANPATLMAIGNGVGSAVVAGGGTIVAQAPFIPVSGALMPVVGPLLAFQCLTTIAILGEFAAVKKGIVDIQKNISRLMERQEAIYIGEALSASQRLEQLENEFEICNSFTTDMMIRLALLENTVNPIFERHTFLYNSHQIDTKLSSTDWAFKQGDAKMAIVLSLLDIRLDVLRVKLAIQENPGFVQEFAESLTTKIDRYRELWSDIEKAPEQVEEVTTKLREMTTNLSWWKRNIPEWGGGGRTKRKETEKQASELEAQQTIQATTTLTGQALDAIKAGADLQEQLAAQEPNSLFYWEDEMGKHSYYSSDVAISA